MPIALSGGARISRRVVTHNHHRSDFALLLADVEHHFQALAQTPADVLRLSGVRLRQTRIKLFLCLSLRPHNQLGSI
jgi:hypothetical protein